MTHSTYKKVFRNPDKLDELLQLRTKGWSFPKLAVYFGVDHTTCLFHCKKYGIKPGVKVQRELPLCKVCGRQVATFYNSYCSRKCMMMRNKITKEEKPIIKLAEEEKINEGVNYATYLKRAKIKNHPEIYARLL